MDQIITEQLSIYLTRSGVIYDAGKVKYYEEYFKIFCVANVFVTMVWWCEVGEIATGVNNVIKIDWCCDSDNIVSMQNILKFCCSGKSKDFIL